MILDLFTPGERRTLWGLSFAVLIRGLTETFAVAAVMPFVAVVASPAIVEENRWLSWLYEAGPFASTSSFLLFLGVGVLLVLALSNGFAGWTTWMMERFVWRKHHDLSARLLRKYLFQPYPFFLDRNTAELSKNLLSEVQVAIVGVFVPLMLLLSRGVVAFCVVVLLVLVDWTLALIVLLVLGGAYGIIYALVQRHQGRIGKERVSANTNRFQFASEAFGGIKETKVADAEAFFLNRFSAPSDTYSRHTATDQVVAQIPRYALEVVAFGGILLIVLVLLSSGERMGQALPLIGLYAFAGYKLMPALQLVFQGLTRIRFNLPSLEALHADLCPDGSGVREWEEEQPGVSGSPLPLLDRLQAEGVGFRYPGAEDWALRGVDISLASGGSLGLVGPTGCGKTTLVDLLLGILRPTEGSLAVDGVELVDDALLARWRQVVAYVPQDLFLLDSTIRENVAYGVQREEIDEARVAEALETADLSGLLAELPDGIDTFIGERGVRLSGGQRQRIGIARALYRDPALLVLDEATSALDGVTEERVMNGIRRSAPGRTLIVIAHRIRTLSGLDRICVLGSGAIADSGSYEELWERNPEFRALATAGGADEPDSPEGGVHGTPPSSSA